MNNVLITGGCGFVGANLVAHLLATGRYAIAVLDNESLGKREFLGDADVEFISGDVRDEALLAKILPGRDAVIHLAADTRVMDSIAAPTFNFEVNVVGTFRLLEAMRVAGVKRFINASTGGAILGEVPPPVHEEMVPRPASPYGASKLAVEGYCSAFSQSYGMHAVSLRFSNVYGPRSFHKGSVVAHFLKQVLTGNELVVYGDGSQTRDYVYVEDLCDGIRRAVEGDRAGVFQLGTGIPTDLNHLIGAVSDVVGPGRMSPVRYEDFRAGEIRATYCAIDRAREALGYDPRTDLGAGLRATWAWFEDNRSRFGA